MFAQTCVAFLLICGVLVVSLPVPTPGQLVHLGVRAGPSGYVIYPPGGAGFNGYNAGKPNDIHVIYQAVGQAFDPIYYTIGIDIDLIDSKGTLVEPLARGYEGNFLPGSFPGYQTIEGFFLSPPDVCGPSQLRITEWQWYNGQTISFVSAAPSIWLTCSEEKRDFRTTETEKRAGPSGYVVYPTGDTHYYVGNTDNMDIKYQPVVSDDSGIWTAGVAIDLFKPNGDWVAPITRGWQGFSDRSEPTDDQILGYWQRPPGIACGEYTMKFTEYQWAYGELINFVSANPTIILDCTD